MPTIDKVLPPFDGVIVPPPPAAPVCAANTPLVSVGTALKLSPLVVGVSEMLTPAIAPACPTPTVAEEGAAIDSVPEGCTTSAVLIAVAVAMPGRSSVNMTVTLSCPVLA